MYKLLFIVDAKKNLLFEIVVTLSGRAYLETYEKTTMFNKSKSSN